MHTDQTSKTGSIQNRSYHVTGIWAQLQQDLPVSHFGCFYQLGPNVVARKAQRKRSVLDFFSRHPRKRQPHQAS